MHTAGPWHWVDSETDQPLSEEGHAYGGSLRTVEQFGENKTEIVDGKSYTSFRLPKFILNADEFSARTDEENVGNRRLIAAAPGLLHAAEQIIDSMGPDDQPPALSAIEALRAAYTKATGRTIPT